MTAAKCEIRFPKEGGVIPWIQSIFMLENALKHKFLTISMSGVLRCLRVPTPTQVLMHTSVELS